MICTCPESINDSILPHLPRCPYGSIKTATPPRKSGAHENLLKAADLYGIKNKDYVNGYNAIGDVLHAMFPAGLAIDQPEQFRRLSTFIMCVTKLQRYAVHLAQGGHEDSAKDLTVYSAMLQEQTT